MIHIQFPDPAWPYWGLAPLRAASRSVDTATEAVRWNLNALQNRGMPDVMFSSDAELDQESYEQIVGRIASAYNSPDNARRPFVMGSGFKAEVVNWKPIEMDFINSMQLYREDICMVYGVPLTMIQVLQDATLANAEALEAGFWRNTMIPYADLVQSALNVGLIPREQRGQRRLCYDLAGVKVLAEDMEKKVAQYATLVSAAVSPNAARKYLKMDLEDEPKGGDMAFIPATLVPLEDAQSIANEPQVTAQPKPRAA